MKTIIIDKSFYLKASSYEFDTIVCDIFSKLYDLKYEYPNFELWLKKVLYDVTIGDRSILLKEYNKEIVALSIIKDTKYEQKISTLRVIPKYQRLGIGTELISESMYCLNNNAPLITVSEKRIDEFRNFFYSLKFEETQNLVSCYKKGLSEIIFNGNLSKSLQYQL